MEYYTLEQDIEVMALPADEFPAGILNAHRRLHAMLKGDTARQYFGISHPVPGGEIRYMAAATAEPAEKAQLSETEAFTIRRGIYLMKTLKNFAQNPADIAEAFRELTSAPNIDPQGYCLEWFFNDSDCRCMVPLK